MESHERLERELAAWSGCGDVVACSSGTAALHLAMEGLALPPGSRVIVPDFTMVACARAVAMAGLRPIFVGCDDCLLMDMDCVDEAMSHYRARAIMAVHIYGRRVDMGALHAIADKWGAPVVEDLAEAHGVRPHPRTTFACWSFYKNKVVAGEEGGAVGAPARIDALRRLRCLGFDDEHTFVHMPRGHNYRLAPSLAEKVRDSLAEFDANVARRCRAEAALYDQCPPQCLMPPRQVPWVFDLKCPDAHAAVARLNAKGVAARRAFAPMHRQPEFKDCPCVGAGALRASESVLYIPMSISEIDWVSEVYPS